MFANRDNGFWILPSRNRPKELARFFAAARKTGMSTRGYVIVGDEDHFTNRFAYASLGDEIKDLGWSFFVVPLKELGQGEKMRMAAAHLPDHKIASWIGYMSDDHEPLTMHWDTKILEDLDGTNYVSGSDERCVHEGRIVSPLVVSRAILDIFGGSIYPSAELRHYYVDDILELVGREAECWKVRLDIVCKHHHHQLDPNVVKDDTYRNNEVNYLNDWKVHRVWLKGNLFPVVEKIRSLKEGV